MRASPGSCIEPGRGGGDSSASAIRRDASTNRRISGLLCRWVWVAARAALARTAVGSKGRVARRRAVSRTSSVRREKLARERARGPLGVWTDSRISKRPFGRATTNAIPTMLPTRWPTSWPSRGRTRRPGPARRPAGGWCHHDRVTQGGHLGNSRWERQAGGTEGGCRGSSRGWCSTPGYVAAGGPGWPSRFLISVVGGIVLAAAAAGRRTDNAFPRFVAAHGFDSVVYATRPVPAVTHLPGVTSATEIILPDAGNPTCGLRIFQRERLRRGRRTGSGPLSLHARLRPPARPVEARPGAGFVHVATGRAARRDP